MRMVNDGDKHLTENTLTSATRRRFLGAAGTATTVGLAGCMSVLGGTGTKPNSVEYWTLFGGGDGDAMNAMVANAAKDHDLSVTKQRSATDYYTRLYTSLIGNEAPDAAIMHSARMQEYKDLVEPLTDEIDTEPYLDSIAKRGVVDGEQLAVPLDAHPLGLYYNKDLFKEAGLDPEKPPNTPKEFKKVATQITKNTNKWAFQYNSGTVWYFVMFLASIGGQVLTNRTKPAFDNQKGLRVAQYMNSWVDKHGWTPQNSDVGWDAWLRGDVGMMIDGTWHINVVRESDFEFGMSKPFIMPNSKVSKTWAGSHMLIMPKSSSRSEKTRAQTIKLIRLLSQDYNDLWGAKAGHLPAGQEAYNSKKLRKSDTWKKTLNVFYEMAENDRLARSPATQNNTLYEEQIVQYLDSMRTGGTRPKAAIEKAAEGIREAYV